MENVVPVSLTHLVGTLHNICRGRRSNSEHPTHRYLKCVGSSH